MSHHSHDRELPDGRALIETAFPLAGPFDAGRVIAAGAALAELTRYMAHATYHRRGPRCAPDWYPVLGSLATATHSTRQVYQQIAERLADLAADPTLRVDARGPDESPAALASWAGELLGSAADYLTVLASLVDQAQSAVGRLYHEPAPGQDQDWPPTDHTDADPDGGGW
jgi:hypothetical protein